jgi:hypothetical protein
MTAHVTVMVGGKPHVISISSEIQNRLDRCGQIFGRTNSGDRFELHCSDQALARGGRRTFATSPQKKETTCEAERSKQVLRLTPRHPRDQAPRLHLVSGSFYRGRVIRRTTAGIALRSPSGGGGGG